MPLRPGSRTADSSRLNPTQEIAGEQPKGPALAVGPARLRIGGYLGLTGIYRSTNSGGGPGTSFASIPYEDQVQGNVNETRLSAQSSRISMRVDAEYPEARPRFRRLSGYFEMDFSGTTPGTVAVTSTSVGLRLRQAFAEVQYGDTFFLAAGQAFSLMTPPKDQLSIWPSDVEMSQAIDTNYLAGMIWDRAPQFRLTWRPSTRFNWAVSIENPEQQLGNGVVTLPACCASDIEAEYNTGSGELSVPNLMPDIATRMTFNPLRALHVDVGGVVRAFRHTVQPYDDDFKDVGGGASVNVRVQPNPPHQGTCCRARLDPASGAMSEASFPTSRFAATAPSARSARRPGSAAWSKPSPTRCRWAATTAAWTPTTTSLWTPEAVSSATDSPARRTPTTGGFSKSPARRPISS